MMFDEFSEEYRKYVVRFILRSGKGLYTLWGTDLSNEDFDYLLLNEEQQILSFLSIENLIDYLKESELIIDPANTKVWVKHYVPKKEYTTYDLKEVNKIINDLDFSLEKLERDTAFKLINFYNLLSDYSYQTQEKTLLKLINEKSTKLFFDFAYNSFFWTSAEREELIKSEAKDFQISFFTKNFFKMIEHFERNISLCST